MASTYMTPGVYIEEKNAFPGSAVAVETAVPVFIGYTAQAVRNGKSLLHVPTKVSSFAEYVEMFGGAFQPKFTVVKAAAGAKDTFKVGADDMSVTINDNNKLFFYNAIRLFYMNGGSNCYILSVGTYEGKASLEIDFNDFKGDGTPEKPSVFEILKKEFEPTLVVLPDLISKGTDAYAIYQLVLLHCQETQSRFGIFDVAMGADERANAKDFREGIGTSALNYGAAYYPWLKTSIVTPSEVNFQNLDIPLGGLSALLPADEKARVDEFLAIPSSAAAVAIVEDANKSAAEKAPHITNIHQSLKASSISYVKILEEVRSQINLLPPSAALAGIYSLVDNTRGVWKSPANVSVGSVNAPSLNISSEEQQQLNVDAISGKSINVIRPFPGIGTLVWGARTLDGNSQDWRYINVRRTLIMIEQSLKLATRTYVFEANDAGTWVTISSMMNNFLYNLWKQGALAGAAPEQAYSVSIGLGSTMTPTDILDGIMRITVKVAIVRPAEFIVITFQQQQQQA
ncbi:MAG: phage tail sheath C-terminal domain-containing protein [Bacteroidota bacterium]